MAAIPLKNDKWTKCSEHIPQTSDRLVLAYFSETGSIETVHAEDFFSHITAGVDSETGNQLYTRWYLSAGVTHWMELPDPPETQAGPSVDQDMVLCRIEESPDIIEGFVGDDTLSCISLLKNFEKWKLGGSRTLPTDIEEARKIVACMQAVLAMVPGPEGE